MANFKLVTLAEREGQRCAFCRTKQSVKYRAKVKYPDGERIVYLCNRCVTRLPDD